MSKGKVKIYKFEMENEPFSQGIRLQPYKGNSNIERQHDNSVKDILNYPRGHVDVLHQYQIRYGFLFLKVFKTNPNPNSLDALRELYSFIGRHKIGKWRLVKYIPKYDIEGL